MDKLALSVVLALSISSLVVPNPNNIATCYFLSQGTSKWMELLANGTVASSGYGTGEFMYHVLCLLCV